MERALEGINATFLLKNGSVLAGAAIITFVGINLLKKSLGNEEYVLVKQLITLDEFELLKNSEWIEICSKLYDFYNLIPSLYLKLLRRILKYLQFRKDINLKIQENKFKTKMGIPRLTRSYLHPIIEGIREMRYTLEKNFGTVYLQDFDEMACEIQNIHNNSASNVLLDAE